MIKAVLVAVLSAALALPALAADQETVSLVTNEVAARGLQDQLNIFENYMNYVDDLSMANGSMLTSLNTLSRKYPSVNQLLQLTTDLSESGYYDNAPLILLNFRHALETARNNGFGSGKFEPWQAKRMKGVCGRIQQVYYTTIKHPAKNYAVGFWLSAGGGVVDGGLLKGNDLKEPCH